MFIYKLFFNQKIFISSFLKKQFETLGSRLSVPVARCILENYPEEDIKRLLLDTDKLGETCLHKATQSASFDSVILLVNSGALGNF